MTAPSDGERISASAGVTISGTAHGLKSGESVWLLDYDPADTANPYYQVNETTIPVVNGNWSFHNSPIGQDSDPIGTTYYVVVIRATQSCGQKLEAVTPNAEGNRTLQGLPAGCEVAIKLTLVKGRN